MSGISLVFSANLSLTAAVSASKLTIRLRATNAANATMLAAFTLPSSCASSMIGTRSSSTSLRPEPIGMIEAFTNTTPPFFTVGANFSSDGRFIATRCCGLRMIGEPTGRSLITTVQ